MKKKLIIHIGTHKTGTSSLQKLTSSLIEELLKEGIKVIDHLQIPNRNEFSKHKEINESLIEAMKKFLMDETKAPSERFLLIWEGFSGDPRQNYANRKVVQEMLFQALPQELDVELVVFFRRQDQFIQSIYTQYKHERDFSQGEDLLKPYYHKGFDWYLYRIDLSTIFKGVTVHTYPYERKYLAEYPLNQILGDILDSSILRDVQEGTKVNIGMNPKAVVLFEKLSPKLNKQETKYLRNVLQTKFHKGFLSDYSYLSVDDQKQWIKLYKENNIELAHFYWDNNIGRHDFNSDFKVKVEDFEKIEEELLLYFLHELEKIRLNQTVSLIGEIKRRIKKLIA